MHFVMLSLQNMASEGSEEQGFYAFMHWLLGEFWVPDSLNWRFIWLQPMIIFFIDLAFDF